MKYTITKLLFAIHIFFLLQGCHFDNLYFSIDNYCPIRLNIDWSKTNLRLNGATVYIFKEDGTLFNELPPFDDPNMINIFLPQGRYNIGIHSNTDFEMPNMYVAGKKDIDDFMLKAISISEISNKYKELGSVGITHLFDLDVNSQMMQYYPYKPGLEPIEYKEFNIQANEFIKQIEVIVKVKGINYAKGAPSSELSGLSGGYLIMQQIHSNDTSSCEFIINKRKNIANEQNTAIISNKIQSFGWNNQIKKNLRIEFNLVNNKKHLIEYDISNKIEMIDSRNYKIEIECELPETDRKSVV